MALIYYHRQAIYIIYKSTDIYYADSTFAEEKWLGHGLAGLTSSYGPELGSKMEY